MIQPPHLSHDVVQPLPETGGLGQQRTLGGHPHCRLQVSGAQVETPRTESPRSMKLSTSYSYSWLDCILLRVAAFQAEPDGLGKFYSLSTLCKIHTSARQYSGSGNGLGS